MWSNYWTRPHPQIYSLIQKLTSVGLHILPHLSRHPLTYQQWLQGYTQQKTHHQAASESVASMPVAGVTAAVNTFDAR